jgi:hypothetical protein
MRWLFDENDNIKAEYRKDYELIPKKSLVAEKIKV